MPERAGYATGIPSWADLATTDRDGAKSFYATIFGWEYDEAPAPESGMDYTMVMKGGKTVAGMATLPEDQQAQGIPPHWSTYIATDDVDASLEKVTAAGGTVIAPAMDVGDTGRMAYIADPTGAAVGLWQAGTHTGAQVVNEHGTLTWNELMTNDTATARAFYESVFGYRTDEYPTGEGEEPYHLFMADGNIEGYYAAGMMKMPPHMAGVPSYWGVYFAVDDADSIVEEVKSAGGAVLAEPFDVPDTGRIAVFQDPQGAVFSVMKPESEMQ